MKNFLLLIATCILLTGSQGYADNYYAGITGGFNWIPNTEDSAHSARLDFDTGYLGNTTLGFKSDCGVKVEGEFGYRFNRLHKVIVAGESLSAPKTKTYTWSTMANALYVFPVGICLQPYAGAGIGYAKSTYEYKDLTSTTHSQSKDGFAYQLIGGAECPINEVLSLDAKYRYQKTKGMRHNQSVEMGLVCAF